MTKTKIDHIFALHSFYRYILAAKNYAPARRQFPKTAHLEDLVNDTTLDTTIHRAIVQGFVDYDSLFNTTVPTLEQMALLDKWESILAFILAIDSPQTFSGRTLEQPDRKEAVNMFNQLHKSTMDKLNNEALEAFTPELKDQIDTCNTYIMRFTIPTPWVRNLPNKINIL